MTQPIWNEKQAAAYHRRVGCEEMRELCRGKSVWFVMYAGVLTAFAEAEVVLLTIAECTDWTDD